jgi:hypothetical protein
VVVPVIVLDETVVMLDRIVVGSFVKVLKLGIYEVE